jgi:hypothetical protein
MINVLIVFLLFPCVSIACDLYVIGFRGKGEAFDQVAFNEYAGTACSRTYNAEQISEALGFIKTINKPYELYGFSLGAISVATVLKNVTSKPEFVLTIGAHSTADVDFDKYGVRYKNYFDNSGKLQKSPGIHVKNIPHMYMQKYVNKNLRNEKSLWQQ